MIGSGQSISRRRRIHVDELYNAVTNPLPNFLDYVNYLSNDDNVDSDYMFNILRDYNGAGVSLERFRILLNDYNRFTNMMNNVEQNIPINTSPNARDEFLEQIENRRMEQSHQFELEQQRNRERRMFRQVETPRNREVSKNDDDDDDDYENQLNDFLENARLDFEGGNIHMKSKKNIKVKVNEIKKNHYVIDLCISKKK